MRVIQTQTRTALTGGIIPAAAGTLVPQSSVSVASATLAGGNVPLTLLSPAPGTVISKAILPLQVLGPRHRPDARYAAPQSRVASVTTQGRPTGDRNLAIDNTGP